MTKPIHQCRWGGKELTPSRSFGIGANEINGNGSPLKEVTAPSAGTTTIGMAPRLRSRLLNQSLLLEAEDVAPAVDNGLTEHQAQIFCIPMGQHRTSHILQPVVRTARWRGSLLPQLVQHMRDGLVLIPNILWYN